MLGRASADGSIFSASARLLLSALAQSGQHLSIFYLSLRLSFAFSFFSSLCLGVGLSCPCRVGEGIKAFPFPISFFFVFGAAVKSRIFKVVRKRARSYV